MISKSLSTKKGLDLDGVKMCLHGFTDKPVGGLLCFLTHPSDDQQASADNQS